MGDVSIESTRNWKEIELSLSYTTKVRVSDRMDQRELLTKSVPVADCLGSLNNELVFFPRDPFQQSLDSQYNSFFATPWGVFLCQRHQV